jgi:phosphoserine phosphatase
MKLFVLRHQESIDNLERIIQGPNHDTPLTQNGQHGALILAKMLDRDSKHTQFGRIVSSPAARCIQTAEIIGKHLSLGVYVDCSLVELNPGIIGGPKELARVRYPEYLRIWDTRLDIDDIPCAERGEELQARTLCFLEQYIFNHLPTSDIVVSHAAFNRCLVNTARGRPRTHPIDVSYNYIHKISDPWINMKMARLPLARSSDTFKIETADGSYVLKQSNVDAREIDLQYHFSSYMRRNGTLLPLVLYSNIRDGHAVQILRYVHGHHPSEAMSEQLTRQIIDSAYDLQNQIMALPNWLIDCYLNKSLQIKLEKSIASLNNPQARRSASILINDARYNYLMTQRSRYPIHYDYHHANILVSDDYSVKFLDLGSLVSAPSDFLPASLFMSCFMLNEPDSFNLEYLMRKWPAQLVKEDISILMQARALIGYSFFEKLMENNHNKKDEELFNKYLRCVEIINGHRRIE